jgi:hypothetical protein
MYASRDEDASINQSPTATTSASTIKNRIHKLLNAQCISRPGGIQASKDRSIESVSVSRHHFGTDRTLSRVRR